mmetsp:Transcript_39177/g.155390  ORF Transcript_39177/g.155390 Transcript_39177/m.155390 type:complete len:383 (-) Transcript_39177:1069-2217(-)|eukprot:CAMPEP_0113956496 /NCGR_PEP_ID=MMETSP0011_2-20120614/2111_1 /TAXON_ID=101924 /ORGANISM="Rhodosorus marinus" /LENGTH=382 /DNA_ID=CAMNT_0000966683 /DNA_START=53 /DNA_END=1201 /DNA_ORIENTATION=+ /assembly_acc=CAM_ASM_000156
MQKDMEAADVTTSGLGTSIVEDAVPAAPVISADALKRRDLILESLRDETRSRVAEKEAEEMTRANRELDLRASRMNAERQFMEESEVEFRRKISQLTDLSAAQQKFDQEHRGDLRAKLDEVAMQQAKYEQEFQGDYKRSVDELATHLNQLDTEIGQMSEVNALAKTAVAAEKSPQPSPVELQLEEADGATILAAATAAEANDAAQDAVVKTSQINEILGDTSKLVLESGAAASTIAAQATLAAGVADDAGSLVPPKSERVVREYQAQVPANLESVEKRIRVDMFDVEQTMAMHPSVEKAVAFPVGDGNSGQEIAVAVQTKAGARVTDKWLRAHAQSILPAMAVPTKWYSIPDIPTGSTREEIASSTELVGLSSKAKAATAMA